MVENSKNKYEELNDVLLHKQKKQIKQSYILINIFEERKKRKEGLFQKVKLFFPEIFSKGCMNNRAPPLTLFNIFNGERGYIGRGT